MALYDTDKNSEDRGNPSPNTHDTIMEGANKSHKTLSTHYTTDADTNAGRLQMQNKQVLGNDGTTNITLYGYNQALNKWGFFVTKPGVEVTTNTDLSQFIFNSNQDILKVVSTSSTTTVIASIAANTTNTTTVPHNLGVIPAFQAYVTLPSNLPTNYTPSLSAIVQMPTAAFIQNAGAGSILMWVAARADSSNLYFDVFNPSTGTLTGPYTFVFKYYILQETAT